MKRNSLYYLDCIEMQQAFPEAVKQHALVKKQEATCMKDIIGKRLIEVIPEVKVQLNLHISKMSGKLEGLYALSTTCVCNGNCIERMKDPESPCHYCFAAAVASRYPALREWLVNNHTILNSRLLTEEEIEDLCKQLSKAYEGKVRIEFAGDIDTVLQGINYIRIMEAGKKYGLYFGMWTKLPQIWDLSIKEAGKPSNVTFILSGCKLNQTESGLIHCYNWIDCIFVVCNRDMYDYTKAELLKRGEIVHDCRCEKGSCADNNICGFCYRNISRKEANNGKVVWILERLRNI